MNGILIQPQAAQQTDGFLPVPFRAAFKGKNGPHRLTHPKRRAGGLRGQAQLLLRQADHHVLPGQAFRHFLQGLANLNTGHIPHRNTGSPQMGLRSDAAILPQEYPRAKGCQDSGQYAPRKPAGRSLSFCLYFHRYFLSSLGITVYILPESSGLFKECPGKSPEEGILPCLMTAPAAGFAATPAANARSPRKHSLPDIPVRCLRK